MKYNQKEKIYLIIIIVDIIVILASIVFSIHVIYHPREEVSYNRFDSINAFNCQFESYEGENTSAQTSALCSQLVANANTFKDEHEFVPTLYYKAGDQREICAEYNENDETLFDIYCTNISLIKKDLEKGHKYTISFTYAVDKSREDKKGAIEKISINY